MKLKTDEPSISEYIQEKITELQHLLERAEDLRHEILTWYEAELQSYSPEADPESELFDPGTGIVVEGISYLSIMESLSELQTFNEARAGQQH